MQAPSGSGRRTQDKSGPLAGLLLLLEPPGKPGSSPAMIRQKPFNKGYSCFVAFTIRETTR
jgi:hypothetical protein